MWFTVKALALREILNYVPQFRGGIFVISIDSALFDSETFSNLFLDIAALRSLNIKVILVHGMLAQVFQLGGELGAEPSPDPEATGVTDEKAMFWTSLASGKNSLNILKGLVDNNLRGAITNVLTAHPQGIIGGVDQQYTGKVERVDAEFLKRLLEDDIIPIVASVGFDGNGNMFRVKNNDVALEIAKAVCATKLIFLTMSDGVLREGKLVTQMSVAEAEEHLQQHQKTMSRILLSKTKQAIKACRSGVNRAHILNGTQDGVLIEEIFSNGGVGTMIYTDEYTSIRKAKKNDLRALMALIQESVTTEELAKRSQKDILKMLDHFYVFEIDGNIVGCVAIEVLREKPKVAEMTCLAVSEVHANHGIGHKLMSYAEERAREMGIKKLLALSTQAFNYLKKKGEFKEGNVDLLPPERLEKYKQIGRNSKILFKDLAG